jgi:hypothetical protein
MRQETSWILAAGLRTTVLPWVWRWRDADALRSIPDLGRRVHGRHPAHWRGVSIPVRNTRSRYVRQDGECGVRGSDRHGALRCFTANEGERTRRVPGGRAACSAFRSAGKDPAWLLLHRRRSHCGKDAVGRVVHCRAIEIRHSRVISEVLFVSILSWLCLLYMDLRSDKAGEQ